MKGVKNIQPKSSHSDQNQECQNEHPRLKIEGDGNDVHEDGNSVGSIGRAEPITFPTTCTSCHRLTQTNMCVVDIPHFKEVIIMSLTCEHCGFKSNEIKAGGSISEFGTRIQLTVNGQNDLTRDVIKSNTAGIEIPELELVLDDGGLDGFYTTVEGLLQKIHNQLREANPFSVGDADRSTHLKDGPNNSGKQFLELLDKIERMKNGESLPFTIIISDPMSNSFINPVSVEAINPNTFASENENIALIAPDDKNEDIVKGLTITKFERSNDQNERLGLNDINTEC